MIKIRLSSRLIPSISLLSSLAVLLAACSPASGAVSPSQPVAGSSPTILAADSTLTPSLAAVSTEAAGPTPLPIVTSRGPELHATDPTTVSLASGELQLVEFFRFTWSTCRAMAPMVHGLEAKYYGRIQFSFLDADDPQTLDIQRSLGFQYQPEIYLLDGKGNVLEKWVGYAREMDLETAFAEHLQ